MLGKPSFALALAPAALASRRGGSRGAAALALHRTHQLAQASAGRSRPYRGHPPEVAKHASPDDCWVLSTAKSTTSRRSSRTPRRRPRRSCSRQGSRSSPWALYRQHLAAPPASPRSTSPRSSAPRRPAQRGRRRPTPRHRRALARRPVPRRARAPPGAPPAPSAPQRRGPPRCSTVVPTPNALFFVRTTTGAAPRRRPTRCRSAASASPAARRSPGRAQGAAEDDGGGDGAVRRQPPRRAQRRAQDVGERVGLRRDLDRRVDRRPPPRRVRGARAGSADAAATAGVRHVQFEGDDGVKASVPVEKALSSHGDVLLAYEMNGEPAGRPRLPAPRRRPGSRGRAKRQVARV